MKASSLGPLLNLDKFVVAHANLPAAVAVATLTMFVVAGLNQPWLCGGGICVCVWVARLKWIIKMRKAIML